MCMVSMNVYNYCNNVNASSAKLLRNILITILIILFMQHQKCVCNISQTVFSTLAQFLCGINKGVSATSAKICETLFMQHHQKCLKHCLCIISQNVCVT